MKTIVIALLVAFAATASAQPKTGTIRGKMIEKQSKAALIGATIVATSSALTGEQVVLTDEKGNYELPNLPAGTYTLTVYYSDSTFSHANIVLKAGGTVNLKDAFEIKQAKNDIVVIQGGPIEAFTITAPNFMLKRADDGTLTVKRGKSVVKANDWEELDGVKFADGSKLTATQDGDTQKLMHGDDVVATVSSKGVMTIGKKKVSFNAKGVLVGTNTKITVSPARLGKDLNALFAVAALLGDSL